jgi:hypothetical protein
MFNKPVEGLLTTCLIENFPISTWPSDSELAVAAVLSYDSALQLLKNSRHELSFLFLIDPYQKYQNHQASILRILVPRLLYNTSTA